MFNISMLLSCFRGPLDAALVRCLSGCGPPSTPGVGADSSAKGFLTLSAVDVSTIGQMNPVRGV